MNKETDIDPELSRALAELADLDAKRAVVQKKISLLKQRKEPVRPARSSGTSCQLTESEKISLFRSLFHGREDLFPKRFESRKTGKSGYQPACANEWMPGRCGKPRVRCGDCPNRSFVPMTDHIIRNHLRGKDETGRDFTAGVYPLLENETCRFLAIDFDKKSWQDDVSAFLETCRKSDVPALLERSRSGNGGHVWIFFSEPVPAHSARQMGSFLITETMENHPDLGFDSYDRFFPNQDTMPKGGFGNLIALPLQAKPRQAGNSVFIDESFQPYPDQWKVLGEVRKMPLSEVIDIAESAARNGRITGVRMASEDEEDQPWCQPPSRRRKPLPVSGLLPKKIDIVLENQIYIEKDLLPAQLKTRLMRTASFQNPEFYRAQAMRMPVYNKPRIISCCEDFPKHIGLPRGCADDVVGLFLSHKILPNAVDKRNHGASQGFSFAGELREEQKLAVSALEPHDIGVLSASTAFGKTVVAVCMIAKRNVDTLVLVHRSQLVAQWRARLESFLGLSPDEIGMIGGGRRNSTGIIDIAMIQSLCKKQVVDDIVGQYGHVVVDECHHLSAVSFEMVARQCKARYFLGLSATLTRKDGHHPIIFMQCGPVRYRVSDKKQAAERPFHHRVIVRKTNIRLSDEMTTKDVPIHQVYDYLMNSEERNRMIVDDVLEMIKLKRTPVVLTERKEHLDMLVEHLSSKVGNVIALKGGMRKKERQSAIRRLSEISEDEDRLIIATGKYLGEGFDDPKLDTLFLTMPISWKGTLSQYAGRLHRLHHQKREVLVVDYADTSIPVTARMFGRRCNGYRAIGYEIDGSGILTQPSCTDLFRLPTESQMEPCMNINEKEFDVARHPSQSRDRGGYEL